MSEAAKVEQRTERLPAVVAIANPGPLGLCGFALTTLVLSLYNVGAGQPENNPFAAGEVVIGLAVAYGGLAQFIAGQWEFVKGNTFGATVFTSYGAFWISFAGILIPGFGSLTPYGTDGVAINNALGIYLTAWGFITFIFFIVSFRTNAATVLLLFLLTVTFLILAIGRFLISETATEVGGAFGIITALVAFYIAFSTLLHEHNGIFQLPTIDLSRAGLKD